MALEMIQVFHATEFGNNEKPYKLVAEFNHSNRSLAFQQTNNIEEPWSEEGHRSTSSGDVIVVNGEAFFLVPANNGPNGKKFYKNFGKTERIENFNENGFIYEEVE
tara:strand:- start:83 stop:400 length:318 start_codon:yes stop_codon:yes gene_type:complete